MRRVNVNLKISKIFWIVVMLLNGFAPIYPGKVFNFNVFQILIMIFWTYGFLCHLGFFKKQVSVSEDGVIRYEISVPILQLGFTRVAQVGYSLLFSVSLSWAVLIGVIVLDIIYVIFIIFDKSSYYYESELN